MDISLLLVLALVLPLLAGCAPDEAGAGTASRAEGRPSTEAIVHATEHPLLDIPQPTGERQIGVRLTEYRVEMTTFTVPAGDVEFHVLNSGRTTHALLVRSAAADVYALTEHLTPGDSTVMTVTLAPGEYDFICPIRDEFDHYSEGMRGKIVVEE